MKYFLNIYIILTILGLSASSCIKNDIPFPATHADFLTFNVRGQLETPQINTSTRTVTIKLSDTVDLARVRVNDFTITDDAHISPRIDDYLNLTTPQIYTLSIWQNYEWKVEAVQTINRNVVIDGQVGNAVIDPENMSAIVYVPDGTAVNNLTITELQLGPSDSQVYPDPSTVHDFTLPVKFTVTYRNVTEEWTLYVMQTENTVTTMPANAWVKLAWLNGIGRAGQKNGFYWKKATDATWKKVEESAVVNNGSNFTARIAGLSPQTNYQYKAYSGEDVGEVVDFTTENLVQLPNAGFELWSTSGDKGLLNPWAQGSSEFWGTGNPGSITLSKNVTTNTPDAHSGSYAAKLRSEYIVIKFAAGNIFAGAFVGLDGLSDGILSFGRPYTSRPTSMSGYFKYEPKAIDRTSSSNPDLSYLRGRPDSCHVYIALCDWTAPLEIRTKPSGRKLFDKNDPSIIAYGELVSGSLTSTYTKFTIDLAYRYTDRRPTYIVVVGSASKYGDYFTGGDGSTLWLDDFELGFD